MAAEKYENLVTDSDLDWDTLNWYLLDWDLLDRDTLARDTLDQGTTEDSLWTELLWNTFWCQNKQGKYLGIFFWAFMRSCKTA